MKGGKTPLGYTVVEVMIVLAISGVMFVMAAGFISGKQQKTAFNTSVNEMASRLQAVINQVKDGQFSDIDLNCSFAGNITSFPPGPTHAQGENPSCVFLGKVVHLSKNNVNYNYEVFTVAGGRILDTGKPVVELFKADPRVIDNLTIDQTISERLGLPNGSYMTGRGDTSVTDPSQTDWNSYAIGFIQSLGSVNGDGDLNNGAQTVGLYWVSGLANSLSNGPLFTSAKINKNTLVPAKSAGICLTDEKYYAALQIGTGEDNNLNISVRMEGTTPQPPCPIT